MAAWSSREYDKPMAASLRMIASAIGIGTGGISSEMVDQMKRSVASSDCDGSNIVEVLERMAEDSDEEEHLGPLHGAASAGKMDVCKHLVENLGFDVDVRANDGSGKTPLTCAVSRGKVIAVRYLIAKGADLNKQDAMGFTPLHYAVKRGYSGIARLLLSRGANVDVESSEGTPLHVSAACGKFGVMEILLEHHADPDRVSPDLYTPLAKILCATYEKASVSACLKCMKLLVKAGADLNSTNRDTPLVIATSRGLNECVDYLLEVGADANIPIKHGCKTPIEIAAKCGRRNLVESLFPFTSPIQTISDWSVEGILAYARSRQSKHKDQKSDNNSKNQLNLNGERSLKEDAGASKGCTEGKLSDEDRKAQLKLHGGQAVKGKDYAGASKFYTKAIMLDPADATLYSNRSFCHLKIGGARDALVDANACISLQPDWPKGYYCKGADLMSLKVIRNSILCLLCFMVMFGTVSAQTHCDHTNLAKQMGFCTTGNPNSICCITVDNIVERSLYSNSSCICEVLKEDVEADKIIKYYYLCQGKKQRIYSLISQCRGSPPPPPPPPPPAEIVMNTTSCDADCTTKRSWSATTITAIVLLSCFVFALSVSLIWLLIKKKKCTAVPPVIELPEIRLCVPVSTDEPATPPVPVSIDVPEIQPGPVSTDVTRKGSSKGMRRIIPMFIIIRWGLLWKQRRAKLRGGEPPTKN